MATVWSFRITAHNAAAAEARDSPGVIMLTTTIRHAKHTTNVVVSSARLYSNAVLFLMDGARFEAVEVHTTRAVRAAIAPHDTVRSSRYVARAI